MAKVRFFCDSGANIHSKRSEVLDTEYDLDLDPGEWETLNEETRMELVREWANQLLEMGYETVEGD